MHRSHLPFTKWLLAIYFVSQDKRGISAVELQARLGVTYKTAWYVLSRIRKAMGQRDDAYQLENEIEFDDAFFDGPTVGKKRGRGTEKAKVFVALSLDEKGNPKFLKMKKAKDVRKKSVQTFAEPFFAKDAVIHTDGFQSKSLRWLILITDPVCTTQTAALCAGSISLISNAKAFILGTFHGLPSKYLDSSQ